MKKIIMIICVAVSWAGTSHAQKTSKLYTATYSSDFVMDDKGYSQKVLQLWKDFENNNFTDDHIAYIADTVTMILQDGTVVKSKATNLAGVKQFRSAVKNMKVTVEAWMGVKSKDRDKNFVLIWGTEDFTDPGGNHVVEFIHEIWGFNKDGQIDLLRQYATPIKM